MKLQFAFPALNPGAVGSLHGRQSGRNHILEAGADERPQRRISVEFLELSHGVIAYVANLRHDPGRERVLDAEVPLLRVRIAEVLRHLHLVGESRISARCQGTQEGNNLRPKKTVGRHAGRRTSNNRT